MSDDRQQPLISIRYQDSTSKTQRAMAVNAALQIILASARSSADHHVHLETEFDELSKYADKIQEALKYTD